MLVRAGAQSVVDPMQRSAAQRQWMRRGALWRTQPHRRADQLLVLPVQLRKQRTGCCHAVAGKS